jgi:hypothetical protein
MVGTLPSNTHVDFTLQNSIILGDAQAGAAIIMNQASDSTLNARLFNNTFWSSSINMNAATSVVMRNNLFRFFKVYPANLTGIDSDYNGFFWETSYDVISTSEGPHSLGMTNETSLDTSVFSHFDISSTGNWGYNDGWIPAQGSAIVGAGIGPAVDSRIPKHDFLGRTRSGTTTNMGAY